MGRSSPVQIGERLRTIALPGYRRSAAVQFWPTVITCGSVSGTSTLTRNFRPFSKTA
jgi:hypothetical protein